MLKTLALIVLPFIRLKELKSKRSRLFTKCIEL